MHTITVTTECGTTKDFDGRREAEEAKPTHGSLCDECSVDDVDIAVGSERASTESTSEGGGVALADADDREPLREIHDEESTATERTRDCGCTTLMPCWGCRYAGRRGRPAVRRVR